MKRRSKVGKSMKRRLIVGETSIKRRSNVDGKFFKFLMDRYHFYAAMFFCNYENTLQTFSTKKDFYFHLISFTFFLQMSTLW